MGLRYNHEFQHMYLRNRNVIRIPKLKKTGAQINKLKYFVSST